MLYNITTVFNDIFVNKNRDALVCISSSIFLYGRSVCVCESVKMSESERETLRENGHFAEL